VGVKLTCQCSECLLAQADFVLRQRSELIGQGAGSTSIVFDGAGGVEFRQRSRSALEDAVEARNLAERQRDVAEKNELRAQIKALARRFEQAQTGGLIRDNNGRFWTRNSLMAMFASQRED